MDNNNSYVLMLPKWFPSRNFPREGNYVSVHIDAISRLTPTVVLYVHSDPQSSKGSYFEVSNDINSTVYRVFFRKFESPIGFLNRLVNFYRFFKSQRDTYKIIRMEKGLPELVHVHVLLRTSFFAFYLKVKHGIPFIISEHWSVFLMERQGKISPLKKILIRFICSKAEILTCVSEALKKGICGIVNKPSAVEVIFNGVDTGIFRLGTVTKDRGSKFKFLHISRLDSHPKNLPGILYTVEKLFRERQDFELHIIGEGKEGGKQRGLSKELGILNRVVFFHGYLNPAEVSSRIKESAFVIVFSNYESQSKVILESFACGKPVIATNVGGIPEMVTNERGILIPPKNEDSLLEAIKIMLDGKMNSYKPDDLRSYAKSVADYDVIGRKFIEVYNRIIQK